MNASSAARVHLSTTLPLLPTPRDLTVFLYVYFFFFSFLSTRFHHQLNGCLGVFFFFWRFFGDRKNKRSTTEFPFSSGGMIEMAWLRRSTHGLFDGKHRSRVLTVVDLWRLDLKGYIVSSIG